MSMGSISPPPLDLAVVLARLLLLLLVDLGRAQRVRLHLRHAQQPARRLQAVRREAVHAGRVVLAAAAVSHHVRAWLLLLLRH